MKKLIGIAITATLMMAPVAMAVHAQATPPVTNPGSPGGDCSHGNSGASCRPDPNEHGQDCDDHGVAQGNEDHCEEVTPSPSQTTPPPPSPSGTPSETPSETPSSEPTPTATETESPRPTVCTPTVRFGPWYGDPRVNVTLTGPGTFTVKGGIQRFSGLRVVRSVLSCGDSATVSRYKVRRGHTVQVFLNGVLFAERRAPRLR